MKKTLLFLTILFMSWATQAQMQKGDALLSSGLRFSSETEKIEIKEGSRKEEIDIGRSIFGMNVIAGYFMNDHFVIGLGLDFTNEKVEVESGSYYYSSDYKVIERMFTIAPFARFYKPLSENVLFYGDFAIGLGFGSEDEREGTSRDEVKINSTNIGITPGFTYMLSEKLALEIKFGFVGYSNYKTEYEYRSSSYSYSYKRQTPGFGLNADLSTLQFSLSFIL